MIRLFIMFLFGFFVIANFSLIPSQLNSPRITDLILLSLFPFVIFKFFTSSITLKHLVIVFFVPLYFIIFAILGYFISDFSLVIASGRIGLVVIIIASISEYFKDQKFAESFCWGAVIGGVVVGIIAVAQRWELSPIFETVIPEGTIIRWDRFGLIRAVGIWQHPNALAQVQTVAAGFALTLAIVSNRFFTGLFFFVVITSFTYAATQTRVGLLVGIIMVLIAWMVSASKRQKIYLLFIIFIGALILLPISFQFLSERWLGITASGMTIFDNAMERFYSTIQSVILLVQWPFGYGFLGRLEILYETTGLFASHNGYLSFALTFGLLPFIIILLAIFYKLKALWNYRKTPRMETLPFLALLLMFLFEDTAFSPSMQISLAICLLWGRQIWISRNK